MIPVSEGQARARRFYERERFGAVGEPFEVIGLPTLEYRRELNYIPGTVIGAELQSGLFPITLYG